MKTNILDASQVLVARWRVWLKRQIRERSPFTREHVRNMHTDELVNWWDVLYQEDDAHFLYPEDFVRDDEKLYTASNGKTYLIQK